MNNLWSNSRYGLGGIFNQKTILLSSLMLHNIVLSGFYYRFVSLVTITQMGFLGVIKEIYKIVYLWFYLAYGL